MPDTHLFTAHRPSQPASKPPSQPLLIRQTSVGLLNLRGNPADTAFVVAVEQALGLCLPLTACTTGAQGDLRLVWSGPDEWVLVAPLGQQTALATRLRAALASQHCAVTDVSSGFFLVDLYGPQVRDILAQGCPIDLHPRAFAAHRAVGTHFFKVGLTLWLATEPNGFQMLVRRSFMGYFWQLIDRATLECGRARF